MVAWDEAFVPFYLWASMVACWLQHVVVHSERRPVVRAVLQGLLSAVSLGLMFRVGYLIARLYG
jgi:hypothetical protein